MKHPVIVCALFILVSFACRKERTCECAITERGTLTTASSTQGLDPILPAIDTTTYYPYELITTRNATHAKISKRAMQAACPASTEETIFDVSVSSVPGLFTVTSTDSGTRTTACKIE
jgi:hypothetical protein